MDSLKVLLSVAHPDSVKADLLYQLSDEADDEKDVLNYAQQALSFSEKINYKKGIADADNNIGYYYEHTGNLEKAFNYYQTSLGIRETIKDKDGEANSLINLGGVYNEKGNVIKALELWQRALKIRLEIRFKHPDDLLNNQGMAYALMNLGGNCYSQGDKATALRYYQECLPIEQKINDKVGMGYAYNSIGIIYGHSGKLFLALEYYRQGLKVREEANNKEGVANSLGAIGISYKLQGNYDTALAYFQRSLKLQEEIGDQRGMGYTLNLIGDVFFQKKNFSKAEEYSGRALEVAKKLGFPLNIKNASESLSKIYSANNKYKDAFEMESLFHRMSDTVNNTETKRASLKTQLLYEFDKKSMTDSVKNVEQAKVEEIKHKQEVKLQKMYSYGGLIGFLLMLLVAGVSYRAYRQKRKANEIIILQKAIVEEKQKEILDSIYYAKRIQQSLLPTEKYIEKKFTKLRSNK